MGPGKNVLFITADQWRGECLSVLGHPCLRTPHLDALAADGVAFGRHYSQATPCGPGRASLYTGMYLHNHRLVANGTPLDERHTNVAIEARRRGYEPALFGYTDVGTVPRARVATDPAAARSDGVLPGMSPVVLMQDDLLPWLRALKAKGYAVGDAGPSEDYARYDIFRPAGRPADGAGRGRTFAPARYRAEDSITAFLTDEVIEFISKQAARPWFVHASYLSPHPPFIAPEPYHCMYDPDEVPAPVRAGSPEMEAGQHPFLEYCLHHQRGSGISFGWSARRHHLRISDLDLRQARATYYGMMSEVDAQIGRLIRHLKREGLYDSTLIVFTSDHGELLGDHWQFAKYGYFDQVFHVPLIIRDPTPGAEGARGAVVGKFTENVDVMPSILEWIGAPVPAQCDGRSLLAFCRGEATDDWRQEAHCEYDFRDFLSEPSAAALGLGADQCAIGIIRDPRYKYVHFAAMPPLLFDLEDDPGEFVDLAADPGKRHLVSEYAGRMLSWRMQHDERVPAAGPE